MSNLTTEQMNKLTTQRLISYQKKQQSKFGRFFCQCCHEIRPEDEANYDKLASHTGEIAYLLSQRNDRKTIKEEHKLNGIKKQKRSKSKGVQSLTKSQRKKMKRNA